MSANTEKCADKDKTVCDYNEFRRLRYFHGMLLDDKDFQAEQQYHSGKRRLLNRMLHGSGVVCGLDLKGKQDGRYIEIGSGLALDCSGNEIYVPKKQHIDLASLLPPKDRPKNADCLEVDNTDDVLKTYYIGIRYEEKPANPVSVYLPSGSCEEKTCENSRYKEGFCIEVVDCCPEKYSPGLFSQFCECGDGDQPDEAGDLCGQCGDKPDPAQQDKMEEWCKCMRLEEFCENSPECAECCSCDKPCYVVLGQIQVDQDCRLQSVCINECRRYVLTGRLVQRILLKLFAGAEDFFFAQKDNDPEKIFVPDFGELINNPIKGLCWVLQNALLEGRKLHYSCDPDKQRPSSGFSEQQVAQFVQAQVQAQVKSQVQAQLQDQLQAQLQAQPVFQRQREIFEKLNLTADAPIAKETKNLDITQPLDASTDKTEKETDKTADKTSDKTTDKTTDKKNK